MRIAKKFHIIVLLAIVGSPGAFGQDSLGSALYVSPAKENLSTFEKSFKPSFYDNGVFLFNKSDTSKIYGTALDQMTTAPPETLQGYRVQLMSTNDYEEALSFRNQFITAYPQLWVYTVYESPSYKIRVGDYMTRTEAKIMLDSLQADGYTTAWIVPDMVINNQPPKPPLPVPIDSTSFEQ